MSVIGYHSECPAGGHMAHWTNTVTPAGGTVVRIECETCAKAGWASVLPATVVIAQDVAVVISDNAARELQSRTAWLGRMIAGTHHD